MASFFVSNQRVVPLSHIRMVDLVASLRQLLPSLKEGLQYINWITLCPRAWRGTDVLLDSSSLAFRAPSSHTANGLINFFLFVRWSPVLWSPIIADSVSASRTSACFSSSWVSNPKILLLESPQAYYDASLNTWRKRGFVVGSVEVDAYARPPVTWSRWQKVFSYFWPPERSNGAFERDRNLLIAFA